MIASFLLVGHQPYAEAMVRSLKATQNCPVVQMSDLRTPKVVGVDEVVRIPFRVPLMLYRLKHLAAYPHDEMLIVDTDVIAKASVADIWDCDFDVGVTVREPGHLYNGDGVDIAGRMDFNTGVMFSRSQAFWAECYRWLAAEDDSLQRWFGDQRAVFEVIHRGGYDTMFLRCAEFNWAPNHRYDSSAARFWHYKGAIRKKWIPSESSLDTILVNPSPITSAVNRS